MLATDLVHVGILMSMAHSLYSASINFTKFKSRKINGGKYVDHPARYMVYLIQAEQSKTQYDNWICGGAIVSTEFIVTSAACVEDVQYMYAISGYSRYVNSKEINEDECTRQSKKKIVYICIPHRYEFAYDKVQKWASIDIAAVKVESPYDFEAPKLRGCTWKPNKIDINYDAMYQSHDRDAIVLGYGHSNKWRKPNDPTDYNQDLKYSPIKILNKSRCKQLYRKTPELLPIIDKYMICAMHEGNLDMEGEIIHHHVPTSDGGAPLGARTGTKCQDQSEMDEEDYNDAAYVIPYQKPKNIPRTLYENQNEDEEKEDDISVTTNKYYEHIEKPTMSDDEINFEDILNGRRSDDNVTLNHTRKAGFCQNDHGGPLVTWVGMRERLIGVASVFRLDRTLSCIGPYLFTSTQCNGGFLHCIINEPEENFDSERKEFDIPKTTPYPEQEHTDYPGQTTDNADETTDKHNETPEKPPEVTPDTEQEHTDYPSQTTDDTDKIITTTDVTSEETPDVPPNIAQDETTQPPNDGANNATTPDVTSEDTPDVAPDIAQDETTQPPNDGAKNTTKPDLTSEETPDVAPDVAQRETEQPPNEAKNTTKTDVTSEDTPDVAPDIAQDVTEQPPNDGAKNATTPDVTSEDTPDVAPDIAQDVTEQPPNDGAKNATTPDVTSEDTPDVAPDIAQDVTEQPPNDGAKNATTPDVTSEDTPDVAPDIAQGETEQPPNEAKNTTKTDVTSEPPNVTQDTAHVHKDITEEPINYADEMPYLESQYHIHTCTNADLKDSKIYVTVQSDRIKVQGKVLECGKKIEIYSLTCQKDVSRGFLHTQDKVICKIWLDKPKLHKYYSRRSTFCDLPPKQRGFEVSERRISWKNHPDGPADNELS